MGAAGLGERLQEVDRILMEGDAWEQSSPRS